MDRWERDEKLPERRILLVQWLLVLSFVGLLYGLWRLQILEQGKYAVMAEQNRVREEPIPAPRGRLLDRHGRVLVDNYPSFTAYLVRDRTKTLASDLPKIAAGLFLDLGDLQDRLAKFRGTPPYLPIAIKADITPQDVAFIDSHQDEFPELETMMVSRRLYPLNGFASSIIGYVGEANQREIERLHVKPGAIVGKAGLEEEYNRVLMGHDGERRLLVNSHGRVVGELTERPPVPGKDLRLTLDNKLQIAAEEAMGQRDGALVALDPQNGDILAMVSRPTYDPNQFAGGIPTKLWQSLISNPEHPLLNKAIQAQLAPGSTFKIVEAAAGLQQGVAEKMHVFCNGGATFYGHYFRCWISEKHKIHGDTDIVKGIAQSCDVFFYTLGNDLGINAIHHWATAFGLGRKTGVDLPHEAAGLIPSPAWKERLYHQPWWKGETISVAIGQGPITVTPLQLAHTIGGILLGGRFMRPHLVRYGQLPASEDPAEVGPRSFTVPLSPTTVATIDAGMRGVVQPGGTAASANIPGMDFGGKTGTAQTISSVGLKSWKGPHRNFTSNAWFVGAYPLEHPSIIVAVLYEHGAEGYFAGRIAAEVIAAYRQEHENAGGQVPAGEGRGAVVDPSPTLGSSPLPAHP